MSNNDKRIDYIEFSCRDVAEAKRFYGELFGWKFVDYGPEYASFDDGRLSGGFRQSSDNPSGGPLVILYATELEALKARIEAAGGSIVRDIFSFPGGRRFHFSDPSGTVLAVWSE